jgi:MoxR-like ATPase
LLEAIDEATIAALADPTDANGDGIKGRMQIVTDPETGEEHVVWLPGILDMAARVGGILYLDEINMMPERATSSLHPCTDWRRSLTNRNKAVKVPGDGFIAETVNLSPDLWIAGTMNPNYRGAGALNEAFANRFRHLNWSYDAAVERNLIPNEAVRTLGDALRQARATGHIRTPIGTSALMRLCDDLVEDGVDMGLYSLLSMFTNDERLIVDEIIESRSFKTLLHNAVEGLHPLSGSGEGIMTPTGDAESPF